MDRTIHKKCGIPIRFRPSTKKLCTGAVSTEALPATNRWATIRIESIETSYLRLTVRPIRLDEDGQNLPAALEDQIGVSNADRIKAPVVIEVAIRRPVFRRVPRVG